ncbi:MAG: hypothetical protein KKE50_02995 [Nanoarchaeota archaeon]|nr:hypothetical protein [Nanoarchaeota archaeon]
MGKCIYCKDCIEDDRAVDVCDSCGRRVWGDKMFSAIKDNMSDSRSRGDLEQGNVSSGACAKMKV